MKNISESLPRLLPGVLLTLGSLYGQVYQVGDYISVEDQQIPFNICANGNGQETLQLEDYNFTLNGGEHYALWLDIFAAD